MSVDVSQFGKVAVLMGGLSAEREISLLSGNAVLGALKNQGIDAYGVDVNENIINELANGNYQNVFIVLHGRGGEDGTMQGLLELMVVPYTGSGVAASSLAMDKLKTKQIWLAMDLPTPDFCIIDSKQSCQQALKKLSLPLIIKPVLEGSSIGMSKVEREEELIPAWEKAQQCGGTVIAECWIEGDEYTATILDKQVLPLIKLETPHKFYDYDAKYEANDTQYICPCGLPEKREVEFSALAVQAFDAVGASSWGRVDFMVDNNNKAWLIEVNTVPGMTSHSLVPMAAKQADLSFKDLVVKILSLAKCQQCV
ncbi:D-alanine--D-alanine ligase [hydrothermal vent metagenome]|uniref:D-alanine--D-alanine ligase n=1 Tax=hydrothermal vent metagenome TaxID=652676 RepID=A0A3B0WGZ0_9ZZZZ